MSEIFIAGLRSEKKPPFYLWKNLPKGTGLFRHSKLFPEKHYIPSEILKTNTLQSVEALATIENDLKLEKDGIELNYYNYGNNECSYILCETPYLQTIVEDVDPDHTENLFRYRGEGLVEYLQRLNKQLQNKERNIINSCIEFSKASLSNNANVMSYNVHD